MPPDGIPGLLCDSWDSIVSFWTKPYLIERLFRPINNALNKSDGATSRITADGASPRKTSGAAASMAVGIASPGKASGGAAHKKSGHALSRKKLAARRRKRVRLAAGVFSALAICLVAAYLLISPMLPSEQSAVTDEGKLLTAQSSESASAERQDDSQISVWEFNYSIDSGISIDGRSLPGNLKADVEPIYCHDRRMNVLKMEDFKHKQGVDSDDIKLIIDVSSNQGKIDWQAVADAGVEAAIIRIGYRGRNSGKVYEDDWYEYNLREARKAGLIVGAYFYSQAITVEEAVEEARFLLKRIRGYHVTLPVAIDYEYESMSVYGDLSGRLYEAGLTPREATDVVLAFCREIENAQYDPMIYANKDMFTNSLIVGELDGKYRIWLAAYSLETKYRREYAFWQCTNSGVVSGIKGHVCLDFWYDV